MIIIICIALINFSQSTNFISNVPNVCTKLFKNSKINCVVKIKTIVLKIRFRFTINSHFNTFTPLKVLIVYSETPILLMDPMKTNNMNDNKPVNHIKTVKTSPHEGVYLCVYKQIMSM